MSAAETDCLTINAKTVSKKVMWDMDTLAMQDADYLILHWYDMYHMYWNFVKGWTITPDIRSINARLDSVWLDLPELPHTR